MGKKDREGPSEAGHHTLDTCINPGLKTMVRGLLMKGTCKMEDARGLGFCHHASCLAAVKEQFHALADGCFPTKPGWSNQQKCNVDHICELAEASAFFTELAFDVSPPPSQSLT